jgi:carbamoyltransferase
VSEYIYILGVPNFANYEASASLLRIPKSGGQIDYVCIGEDRLTRIKHTYMFPLRGIDYCLRHFGLDALEQVDYIATDYARIPRWHNSGPAYRKLEHDYLKLMLRYPRERILIIDHHDAHAASCYYPSNFKESGVLVVDGMGSELNTQTAYHFDDNRITWVERGFDWGIGRLYSFVTSSVLPYGPEKGYGKVMGLAPYGAEQRGKVLDFKAVNKGMTADYSGFYSRYPISRLVAKDVPHCEDRQKVLEYPFAKAAYEIQQECEEQLISFAHYIHKKTGTKRLCIAGGVGLNGRANYRILRETPIVEIWIQPACSDTGISFGLALWAHYQILTPSSFRRCFVAMPNAYCGSVYAKKGIENLLQKYEIDSRPVTNEEVARWLAEGKIVARFEGGSEFGPRALGHRSILADSRDPAMKDKLNSSVKFREPYRPYAPVVLREHVSDYFDIDMDSPFMLIVADVKEDKRKQIPAVTHIDGTARIQTVTKKDHGHFYDLLKAFYDMTEIPVLLNTSFNVNREPIVETPLDALICALSTSIDYLVIEGQAIECRSYRKPELVQKMEADRKAAMESHCHNLTKKYLHNYNVHEMKTYLEEENRIAEWYKDYRAKYELEKAMLRWRKEKKNILIVGTRAHTKCLFLYIPEFPSINVVGFVPDDEEMGERGDFKDFNGVYRELNLAQVSWDDVDEVLISSHEYQRKLTDKILATAPVGKKINCIYDTACDSLLFTLPGKWPIVNPHEAVKYGLSMMVGRQRTASNIDFDFEPTPIDIGERYGIAINYHFLRPSLEGLPFKVAAAESPKRFAEQLSALRENFTFCRCKDLVDPSLNLPESNILITFDDGLKDVIRFAVPVLKRFGIPATFFVCAQPYAEGRILTVQKIQFLMSRLGLKDFRKTFDAEMVKQNPAGVERQVLDYANGFRFYRYDTEEIRQFKLDLNYLIPYDKLLPVLDIIFAKVFGNGSEKEMIKEIYLSLDDLKKLVDEGFEVGIHGYDHKVLPRLDYKQQKQNLEAASDFLSPIVGHSQLTVAYPYGFFDNTTKRILKELRILAGFGMGRRAITPKDIQNRWEIPRYDVNDCFNKNDNSINYRLFSSLSTGE